jgi:4-alpha-glucanotransferase
MIDHHLRELARLCGIAPHWRTHWGDERSVAQHDLARMLSALGYPSGNKSELSDSRARALRNNASRVRPPLIVMNAGERVRIPADGVHSRIGRVVMDDGACIDMRLDEYADGFVLGAALDKTGYHRLIIDDRETLIAVAPQRCFTLDDIAPNARMWGLTAQIHALRMPGDRGSGGFGAIGALATSAARQGADAIAISPSHALFCADSHHFSPYSPSTRFFLNTAHIDLAATFSQDKIAHAIHVADIASQMARLEALELVDWPGANTTRRKLHAALYQWFRDNITHDAHLNQDYQRFLRYPDPGLSIMRALNLCTRIIIITISRDGTGACGTSGTVIPQARTCKRLRRKTTTRSTSMFSCNGSRSARNRPRNVKLKTAVCALGSLAIWRLALILAAAMHGALPMSCLMD